MPQGNPAGYAPPPGFTAGGNPNDPSQGLGIADAAGSPFSRFVEGMPGPVGKFAQGERRGRMAEALARQLRANREGGMNLSQSFHQLMQSPEFAEAFVRDPNFGQSVAEAAQLARQPTPETLAGAVGQAQEAGFISPQQGQQFNILGQTDLKGAIERFASELIPEPLTLAQIAQLEQNADFFDRTQNLAERKFLLEFKKFELEQRLALDPTLDNNLAFQDRFRAEAKPYISNLREYEKVTTLRGKRGSEVSDAAAGGIVLAYLSQIKGTPVAFSGAASEAEALANTGALSQRLTGIIRRFFSGDRIQTHELDAIADASTDLAVIASEGFNSTAEAFVNTAVSNFPRSNRSRDEFKARIIPDVVQESTLSGLKAERARRRTNAEKEGISAARARQSRPTEAPQVPTVARSQEQVDALEPGSTFLWTDGNVYVKE